MGDKDFLKILSIGWIRERSARLDETDAERFENKIGAWMEWNGGGEEEDAVASSQAQGVPNQDETKLEK